MKTYQVTTPHQKITVLARDKETAAFVVRMSAGCNILKVRELKTVKK